MKKITIALLILGSAALNTCANAASLNDSFFAPIGGSGPGITFHVTNPKTIQSLTFEYTVCDPANPNCIFGIGVESGRYNILNGVVPTAVLQYHVNQYGSPEYYLYDYRISGETKNHTALNFNACKLTFDQDVSYTVTMENHDGHMVCVEKMA